MEAFAFHQGVPKGKELREYGEYSTRRLALETFDRFRKERADVPSRTL